MYARVSERRERSRYSNLTREQALDSQGRLDFLSFRDQDDLAAHIDYAHYNPAKHGDTRRASRWACRINLGGALRPIPLRLEQLLGQIRAARVQGRVGLCSARLDRSQNAVYLGFMFQ